MMNETTFDEAGHGPAIVLLHGYPFDRSMWREQIDFLSAAGYRAIVPDLRGQGETESSSEIATMDEMARDVAALIDELQIDQVVVCGLSMGGYVALEFAHLYPSRLRALVLAGTRAPADNESEREGRAQQVKRALAEGMKGIAEATLPKLLARRTLVEKPEVVVRVRDMILRAPPQGAAAAQRGMAARRDYSGDLPRINVPTLVVVGREDTIRPVADAEFMKARIPESHLEIIDDAAHMTNMEQPEAFNNVLLRFLEKLDHGTGASPPS